MNCRFVEKHLMAMVESTLPQTEREAFEKHISQCETCRELTDFVAGVVREADPPDEIRPSPDFWPRVNRRIDDYERAVDIFEASRDKYLPG